MLVSVVCHPNNLWDPYYISGAGKMAILKSLIKPTLWRNLQSGSCLVKHIDFGNYVWKMLKDVSQWCDDDESDAFPSKVFLDWNSSWCYWGICLRATFFLWNSLPEELTATILLIHSQPFTVINPKWICMKCLLSINWIC